MATKRLIIIALLVSLLPLASVARAAVAAPTLQTAPCVTAVAAALSKNGSPYVWGAKGPGSFDCSGLTWWSYMQAGLNIGRGTYDQLNYGTQINCNLGNLNGTSTTCWAPGDLVFLNYPGGQHVAMYTGSGLFEDCYNETVGCVLHAVQTDTFYQAHFYQARRITSGCEGMTVNPGTPTTNPTTGMPAIELATIPDLLLYLAFTVPQCNACAGSPDAGLHYVQAPAFSLDVLYPFKWLAAALQNMIIAILCWLLHILQLFVNIITSIANTFIAGINAIWRFLVFAWLTIGQWLYGLWAVIEMIRDWWQQVQQFILIVRVWITAIYSLSVFVLGLIGQFLVLILSLFGIWFGLIGYIQSFAFNMFVGIIATIISGATIPAQLAGTHIVYYLMHGALRALFDSSIGYLMYLIIALCYVGFVFWLARFMSASPE